MVAHVGHHTLQYTKLTTEAATEGPHASRAPLLETRNQQKRLPARRRVGPTQGHPPTWGTGQTPLPAAYYPGRIDVPGMRSPAGNTDQQLTNTNARGTAQLAAAYGSACGTYIQRYVPHTKERTPGLPSDSANTRTHGSHQFGRGSPRCGEQPIFDGVGRAHPAPPDSRSRARAPPRPSGTLRSEVRYCTSEAKS